jgi:hypothetical protein
MDTVNIVEFVTARLDEIEAAAKAAIDSERPGIHWQWVASDNDTVVARGDIGEAQGHQPLSLRTVEQVEYPPDTGYGSLPAFLTGDIEEIHPGAGEHIIMHDPAYVLADIAAKRAILGVYTHVDLSEDNGTTHVCGGDGPETYYEVLQQLALPFADHPDYQQEWKP